jgi:hypothetical protein
MQGPPATHDSRLLGSLRGSSSAFNGWERDSPKGFYPIVIVMFGKLDGVSGNSPEARQLRDHPGRNLSATLISNHHSRANQQLTIQLDGGSMLIQVGGFGGHRKGALLAIFP